MLCCVVPSVCACACVLKMLLYRYELTYNSPIQEIRARITAIDKFKLITAMLSSHIISAQVRRVSIFFVVIVSMNGGISTSSQRTGITYVLRGGSFCLAGKVYLSVALGAADKDLLPV